MFAGKLGQGLPFLAVVVESKDEIESWKPKYASLRQWLPTIEKYVRVKLEEGAVIDSNHPLFLIYVKKEKPSPATIDVKEIPIREAKRGKWKYIVAVVGFVVAVTIIYLLLK